MRKQHEGPDLPEYLNVRGWNMYLNLKELSDCQAIYIVKGATEEIGRLKVSVEYAVAEIDGDCVRFPLVVEAYCSPKSNSDARLCQNFILDLETVKRAILVAAPRW